MDNLFIKNGAIYNKEGVRQILEFGNVEQIALIKKHGRIINLLNNEGIEQEPMYEIETTGVIIFKCICGLNVYFQTDAEDEDDLECFDKSNKICKCGNSYVLNYDEEKNKIFCKLKKLT